MRPARAAAFRAGYELPAAFSQEPVIRPGDEGRSVFERYAIGRLDDAPVHKHAGPHVSPVPALAYGAVDGIPGSQLRQRPRSAVRHEDQRIAGHAVDAP